MLKKIFVTTIILGSVLSCDKKTETKDENGQTSANEATTKKDSLDKKVEVIPAITDSAGVYTLKFKLEVGKTYPLNTHQTDIVSITDPSGKSMKATQNMIDEMSFTVNSFKDGIYDISINLIAKKTDNEAQGKKVTIDTKQAEPKEEALKMTWKVNKALVGKKLTMKMDDKGDVSSITGFDPIYQDVDKAVQPIFKDAKQRKDFVGGFKQGFNEKSLKEQFVKNLVIFPKKGVKVGESWSHSENVTPDGKVKINTKYTLVKVEEGKAEIKIAGGIPTKSDKKTQEHFTRTFSLDGVQTGTVMYDVHSGWIASSQINLTTTQKESLSDGKQTQSMTQKSNSIIKINP